MNKSYKQFSLTTLQLPAPSSNLTLAEYKDKYGIDLKEVYIPSFKLVVYGKDKYAIDQIKAVEGGYEIYFNGRVLSITDIVQTSNEVYDISNSKPIYCHPISLRDSITRIICLIFDNTAEAYTKETFISLLKTFTGRVLINGCYKDSIIDKLVIPCYVNASNNKIVLIGTTLEGAGYNSDTEGFQDFETFIRNVGAFSDDVNKIN